MSNITTQLNKPQVFNLNYGGKDVRIETNRLAKQADGSVFVSSGGTQVLVTVCSAKKAQDGMDFFPLMVDYKEKFYAAGKFLGGFMKREGRPSNREILLMRMIDRPFRPLFPEGYYCETIVTAQVLSYDPDHDPQILAGLGTATAFLISDIPMATAVGFCKVGLIDNNFVLNPNSEQLEQSQLDMIVAGSSDAILMVEGESDELSEEQMLKALDFAHTQIKEFCSFISEIAKKVGKTKRTFEPVVPNKKLMEQVREKFATDARKTLEVSDKQERVKAIAALGEKVQAALEQNPEKYELTADDKLSGEAKRAVDEMLYTIMRTDILKDGKRIGNRKMDEVRPIETEVGILAKTHGSALFTRGETQVLATTTLGGKDGEQMVDSISGISFDKFYLHYTFMPFSVGEAYGYRGVGRREVGHGNLAERAIKKVIDREKCPYTIRLACEVLESNGSSSMGSVCSGCLSLMDAGVPLKAPVAGIAMGLIKEGNDYQILSDILGDEDHLGDMDFKVAGTEKGITAIQMDIKISGLSSEIMQKAMMQAKQGRLHILKEMSKTIETSRTQYKDMVPLIRTLTIEPGKIGVVIGPGGKNIKAIQEKFNVVIECEDSGLVRVIGRGENLVQEVIDLLDIQVNGPKIGTDYPAKVVTIKEYGAFVDIVGGVSGLVHVSEISDERVNDVNEYLKEGDQITVRVLDVDRFGKVSFSIKAVKPAQKRS